MKKFFIFLTILAVYSFQSFSQEYVIPLNSKKSNIEVVRNTKSDLQMVFSLSDIYGNNVTSKNGDEFVELNFDQGFTSGEFGTPKLPVFSKLIQIPFDAEVSISVNNYTSKEYSLEDIGINHKIYPIQPSIRKDQDLDKVPFEYKKEAYEREGFLKNPIATVKVLGTLRGVRIARVEVFPIDYDPANGKLLVRNDIEVAFQFSGANTELENKVRLATASPYFDQIYAQLANSDTKDAYDDHPDNTKYPIKMLIISDRMFEGTLAPYIEWKTKKGFYVEVAYTDVIGTSASVIKTYIHNIYNAATPEDPAPTFVVFVGDTPQIPASQIGTQSAKATDLYYCSVDGDYFPEMYYGRLSATTTQQLQNILDKILYYEQYQFDDPTYLNDMNLIAGADASWNPAVGQPTLKYGTAYYFNDAHGFNTIYEYGVDNDPNNTIEQSDYTGCYGADQLKVSMINYTAHCSETSWGTPNLTSTTINGMTNANKYPLSIGNCCLSAEFGYGECIGESWIRAANKGAVTYIGSSPSSYWHEDFYWAVGAFPYSTGGYVPTFEETTTGSYDAPFVSDYVSTGGLVFVGNLAVTVAANNGYEGSNKLQYYWEAYNVLGDPSLVAYLTEGETNVVSHMPTLPIGVDSYNVVALPGSYVAISKDGVLHGTALVDNSGSVDVSIVPVTDGGNVDIVVTRPQTIPYTAQVPAAALEGPYITLDSYQVNDASGNANGLADFDESFTLNVTLKNVGADNATGVTATISGTDTHFSITASGPTSFGDIASGETGNTSTVNNAFSFDLTNNVPDQYSKTFLLTITDGEDVWESNLSLTANAPDLSIGTLSIDDAAGNSDGIVDPGETANLIVTLKNEGAASVGDAEAWMTLLGSGSSYLTLNDTQLSGTDIPAGGSITVTFNVTADAGTPLGTPVDFTVDLEAGASGQYSASGDKQIIIGFVPEYCESYATSASWSD
ncbi:MAG TPA: C25 family cysteine peptidase, partial [Tenuifilaceae bacterium]|nr:C25 family cysteine peptidase [Tenuifilaceae bacterium]